MTPFDSDRIDMVTTTDSVGVIIDHYDLPQKPSISEVGNGQGCEEW